MLYFLFNISCLCRCRDHCAVGDAGYHCRRPCWRVGMADCRRCVRRAECRHPTGDRPADGAAADPVVGPLSHRHQRLLLFLLSWIFGWQVQSALWLLWGGLVIGLALALLDALFGLNRPLAQRDRTRPRGCGRLRSSCPATAATRSSPTCACSRSMTSSIAMCWRYCSTACRSSPVCASGWAGFCSRTTPRRLPV